MASVLYIVGFVNLNLHAAENWDNPEKNGLMWLGSMATVEEIVDVEQAGVVGTQQVLSTLMSSLRYPQPSGVGISEHFRPVMFQGLPLDHSVILVNGKRRHSAAQLHINNMVGRGTVTVDLNMIPLAAVERVQVSKEGASALYGSDALAGVVNFRLKQNLGGSFTAQVGTHITEVSAVSDLLAVFQDNGQLLFEPAGDRNPDDGDGNQVYLAGDWGFALGPNGFAHFSAEYRDSESTDRTGFDTRFQYSVPGTANVDLREQTFNRFSHKHGQADIRDFNFFLNSAYPLSDRLELYLFASHGTRTGLSGASYRRAIDPENLTQIYPDGFLPTLKSDIDDLSLTLGLRGERWGWNWDLSYADANNEIDLFVKNSLNTSMGVGSPLDFSVGNNESQQQLFNLDAQRAVSLAGVSNPINVRLGLEYRLEAYEIERGELASYVNGGVEVAPGVPGAIGSQGLHGVRPQDEFDEGRENISFYLNADSQMGERLNLFLAARLDDYSDVGGHTSGKVGVRYQLSEALSTSFSISRDFKAPALAQQFYSSTQTLFGIGSDTGSGLDAGVYAVDRPEARALGALELKAESSLSYHLNVNFAPGPGNHLQGLGVRLHFYQTDIDDRLVLSSPLEGSQAESLLQSAGINQVASVQYFHNGLDTQTRGVDLNAHYEMDLARHGRVQISASVNFNKTDITASRNLQIAGAPDLSKFGLAEQLNLEQGVPEGKYIFTAVWLKPKLTTTLRLTGLDSTSAAGPYSLSGRPGANQSFDRMWLLDLALQYQATKNVQVMLGSNNLLDAYPDVLQTEEGSSEFNQIFPFSNFSPYAYNGRYMYARINTTF